MIYLTECVARDGAFVRFFLHTEPWIGKYVRRYYHCWTKKYENEQDARLIRVKLYKRWKKHNLRMDQIKYGRRPSLPSADGFKP